MKAFCVLSKNKSTSIQDDIILHNDFHWLSEQPEGSLPTANFWHPRTTFLANISSAPDNTFPLIGSKWRCCSVGPSPVSKRIQISHRKVLHHPSQTESSLNHRGFGWQVNSETCFNHLQMQSRFGKNRGGDEWGKKALVATWPLPHVYRLLQYISNHGGPMQ